MSRRPEYFVLCENCGENQDFKFDKRKAYAAATQHAAGRHHVVMVYRKDLVLDNAVDPRGILAQEPLF